MSITEQVFKSLDESLNDIEKEVAEESRLAEAMQSGRYSSQALHNEIMPKRDEVHTRVKRMSYDALQKANNLISGYEKEVEASNQLNPEEITDDIKLLQAGIILKPRDIQGMLERNRENRTMLQIILRYAEEHKIDTGGTWYTGGRSELNEAKALKGVLQIYEKWITTKQAREMLYKFFNVSNYD